MPAYRQWNRGKRIHVVDLHEEQGRTELRSLAAECDVVIENLRPRAAAQLGVSWEQLHPLNPGLILLSITGFGTGGRYADYKAYEGTVAAKCGQFLIQNGYRSDGPIYDAVAKGIFGASMLGLIGVLAALEHRTVSLRGQHVETSLVQSTFVYSYGGLRHPDADVTRTMNLVQGRDPHNDSPGYRIAQCADGQWIQSGSFGPGIFENLMRALGIDEYFTDPRFARGVWTLPDEDRRALNELIDRAYPRRPLAEWLGILNEHDAAYGIFLSTQEYMSYPQMLHNAHVIDVKDPVVGDMRQLGPLASFAGLEWEWPGAPEIDQSGAAPHWHARPDSPRHTPAATADKGALSHLRILELSMYAAAPGGPGLLAELGAEVIKVEPLGGDPIMRTGGELYVRITRGKHRIAIDLKDPRGQAAFQALVVGADVVVHNFRPGVPERLGVDYLTLSRLNDRLVYVYAAAFGSSGPDSRRPAFDPVVSAMAGGEVLQAGRGNPPQQRQTADHSALLGVGAAILLGVRQRDQTGTGQYIETTMLASAAYLFSDDFLSYDDKPARPEPDSGQHGLSALYRLYRAKGDDWVFLACLRPDEWERLVAVIDPGLASHFPLGPNEVDHTGLAAALSEAFAARSSAHWEEVLQAVDVSCVAADQTWPAFLFDDPTSLAPSMTGPFEVPGTGTVQHTGTAIDLSLTPAQIGPLEGLGESTLRILSDTDLAEASIVELLADGVISDPAAGTRGELRRKRSARRARPTFAISSAKELPTRENVSPRCSANASTGSDDFGREHY